MPPEVQVGWHTTTTGAGTGNPPRRWPGLTPIPLCQNRYVSRSSGRCTTPRSRAGCDLPHTTTPRCPDTAVAARRHDSDRIPRIELREGARTDEGRTDDLR